jgi:CRP-like cAMP-binding protein
MDTSTPVKKNIIAKTPARLIKPVLLHPGTRSDAAGRAVNNVILLSLPDREYRLLRPHLESADLPQYEILEEPGERINFTHFLNDGMASLVALSRDGRSIEVGIVGKEGMVGMSLMAGLQRGTFRAIMQMAGNGVRIPSGVFQDVLSCAPTLRADLSRFA